MKATNAQAPTKQRTPDRLREPEELLLDGSVIAQWIQANLRNCIPAWTRRPYSIRHCLVQIFAPTPVSGVGLKAGCRIRTGNVMALLGNGFVTQIFNLPYQKVPGQIQIKTRSR